jgi:RNA polymerase sigma-70 factor (ECF subfamily)
MRNSFINNCRRRSRECLTDFTIPTCEAIQSMPAPQEMQLYAQEVGKALAQLPTDQRDALLEVSSGARYHLVARASGCEVGTVKSRVSRARSKLLASLGESPLPRAAAA